MSSQSSLDRIKDVQINRKESIWLLIGVTAGLLLGLLIGWVFWPVEWTGSAPASMDRATQIEYLSTVADAYATYSTPTAVERAQRTLAPLGDDLPALFDEAVTLYGAQPDGGVQVANLAALASALGVTVSALPAAPAEAGVADDVGQPAAPVDPARATGDGATDAETGAPAGANGLWNGLLLLLGIIAVGAGAYGVWVLYTRLRASANPPGPAVGPLTRPGNSPPGGAPSSAATITAYSAETPPRTSPPAYSAAQAAATRVQPVQPPAMVNVAPFEPEDTGVASRTGTASPAPIAPSVAVAPPATHGGFIAEEIESEPDADDAQAPLAGAAVGQRLGASTSWMAGAPRIERYPTIDRAEANFTAGMEHFDWAHNIPGPQEGVYLGEYGIGISERHGMLDNDPEQVVAIEVYIFDKSDDKHMLSASRVLLSEYADTHLRKHFEREKDRLGPVVAQPNTTLQLEARQFVLLCTIRQVVYSEEGIFKRVQMDLELKKKI